MNTSDNHIHWDPHDPGMFYDVNCIEDYNRFSSLNPLITTLPHPNPNPLINPLVQSPGILAQMTQGTDPYPVDGNSYTSVGYRMIDFSDLSVEDLSLELKGTVEKICSEGKRVQETKRVQDEKRTLEALDRWAEGKKNEAADKLKVIAMRLLCMKCT